MIKNISKLLLVIFIVSCNQKSGPILNVDTSFLEKINDTTTQSSFIIRNGGNKILVIEDFVSSCECTVLNINKRDSILPGKFVVVPITIERDSSNEKKLILITLKTNTVPQLKTIKVII